MMAAVGLFGQDVTLAKPQEKAAAFNMGSKVTYNLGAIPIAILAKLNELEYPLFVMQLGYLQTLSAVW